MKMDPNAAGFTYEQACAIAAQNGEEVIPAYCAMCGPDANCRVYAFKKDGKMTRVMGMNESRRNRGTVCAKAILPLGASPGS